VFNNKSILITGGTGSFGKAFTHKVLAAYKPKKVAIYSRDELKQYEIQQDLTSPVLRFFLGDVRDQPRLTMAMRDMDYVIHAAALKQVPAAEYNPMECIKTNIHGAENVISAALANNVEKVIALSTDKAANPINLYGATKLASDKLFTAANNIAGGHRTRFSVVRYGNVVGSRGSVVPLFRRLISEGKKTLPVTDERMTRFWITLNQGVEFVMKCFARMHGGEIFVPKIPSIRIVDLVRAMGPDLKWEVVGVRPGEKLHEVMCPADDSRLTLEFDEFFVIKPTIAFLQPVDYAVSKTGERARPVPENFVYESGSNSHFLAIDEIRRLNEETL